jgi:serine/threonine protein kinase
LLLLLFFEHFERGHRYFFFFFSNKMASRGTEVSAGRNKYIIARKLGSGASGQVCLAAKKGSKQMSALKLVPNHNPVEREHVHAEIHALEELGSHENIPSLRYYGLDEQSNVWFLDMEYAAGGDFLKRIEEGPMSEEEARPLAYDVASALAYAHSQGLCHRDIKLESMSSIFFFLFSFHFWFWNLFLRRFETNTSMLRK